MIVPAVTENVTLPWLAGMVTAPGADTAPDVATETAVAEDAAFVKDTVQVEVALLPRLEGVHVSPSS